MYNRTVKASSEIFDGFEIEIDIRYIDNFNDIIHQFKKKLSSILKNNNLIYLFNLSKKNNWHIHSTTFEDILLNNNIIYICDHC